MKLPAQDDSRSTAIERLTPNQLARLLEADESGPGWSLDDAAGALRQQVTAALLPDLAQVPGAERERLEMLVRIHAPGQSFGTQLTSLEPHVELLEAIKEWSRFMRTQNASPLNGGPATVLYFAAIAAALARRQTRITKLSDADLREGFQWAAVQDGAESLTALLQAALRQLSAASHPSPE